MTWMTYIHVGYMEYVDDVLDDVNDVDSRA